METVLSSGFFLVCSYSGPVASWDYFFSPSWWKIGFQELSKVMQWHLNIPLDQACSDFINQSNLCAQTQHHERGLENEYLLNNTVCWDKDNKEVNKDHV